MSDWYEVYIVWGAFGSLRCESGPYRVQAKPEEAVDAGLMCEMVINEFGLVGIQDVQEVFVSMAQ